MKHTKLSKFDKLSMALSTCMLGVGIIFGLILPKEGIAPLYSSALLSLSMIVISVIIINKIEKLLRFKDISTVITGLLLSLILGLVGLWNAKDVVQDIIEGPKLLTLHDADVIRKNHTDLIMGQHYYVEGYDEEDDKHSIEIPKKYAESLAINNRVTVMCYINSNKLCNLADSPVN